jgi:hypothetical protein
MIGDVLNKKFIFFVQHIIFTVYSSQIALRKSLFTKLTINEKNEKKIHTCRINHKYQKTQHMINSPRELFDFYLNHLPILPQVYNREFIYEEHEDEVIKSYDVIHSLNPKDLFMSNTINQTIYLFPCLHYLNFKIIDNALNDLITSLDFHYVETKIKYYREILLQLTIMETLAEIFGSGSVFDALHNYDYLTKDDEYHAPSLTLHLIMISELVIWLHHKDKIFDECRKNYQVLDEKPEEPSDETSNKTPEDNNEEKPEETSDEKSEDNNEEKPEETSNKTPEDNNEEKPEETSDEKSEETSDEKPEDNNEEKPEEPSNEKSEKNFNEIEDEDEDLEKLRKLPRIKLKNYEIVPIFIFLTQDIHVGFHSEEAHFECINYQEKNVNGKRKMISISKCAPWIHSYEMYNKYQ